MSKATKKKHVTKEVLEDFVLPEKHQNIVKITASRGNNLHEVIDPNGKSYLVSMPTKFRKNVWIKRGDFVITEPIEEGDKVKAEIIHILYKEQIKYIKDEKLWPEQFDDVVKSDVEQTIPDDMLPPSDDSDYEDGDLVMNVNRPHMQDDEDDEDTDESDDENNRSLEDKTDS